MMTPEEFCQQWCGTLSHEQRTMMLYKYEQGDFLGVGRPVGGTQLMPLVLLGEKTVNVIDGAGYYQMAAIDGRRGWTLNNTQ